MSIKLRDFIKSEAFSGVLLIVTFVLALIISNNSVSYSYYQSIVYLPVTLVAGSVSLKTTVIEIVNDGMMTLFFLLLGLEMKYHLVLGEYKNKKKLILPTSAALGGLLVPALIYVYFNFNQPTLKGWAIPIATDTAFVLGILSFYKRHVSIELKIFVVGLSLIDDAIALIILAIFYTQTVHITALVAAVFLMTILVIMNLLRVVHVFYYMLVGLLLWVAMVEAGIHGTLCGAIVALAIPVRQDNSDYPSASFKEFEGIIKYVVNYFIVPTFIFLNSGIPLENFYIDSTYLNVSLGIILGLFVGKQLGVFIFSYPIVKYNICPLPNTSWPKFYAIAILSGIGFTLSLFIGRLTFEQGDAENSMRGAVIIGSMLSAPFGMIVLKYNTVLQALLNKDKK